MNALYTATVSAKGGREGKIVSSDGQLDLNIEMPKGLGGNGGNGTNPEQLFAAGYSACFGSALGSVIESQKIKEVTGSEVTANVSIYKDGSGFKLGVVMEVKVEGVDLAKAQELADAAHQVCPYSKATRGNIDVEIKAVG